MTTTGKTQRTVHSALYETESEVEWESQSHEPVLYEEHFNNDPEWIFVCLQRQDIENYNLILTIKRTLNRNKNLNFDVKWIYMIWLWYVSKKKSS